MKHDILIDETIGKMFESSFAYLRAYIFSLCVDDGLADDVLEKTLNTVLKELKKFDHRTSTFVWLCNIAKKELHNPARKPAFVPPEENPNLRYYLKIGRAASGDTDLYFKKLSYALKQLDPTYKEIFYMHVLGDLPFAVIAELYGRPESWARTVFLNSKDAILRYMGV